MKVLLAGNVGYLSDAWIGRAFGGEQVIIAGETDIQGNSKEGTIVAPFDDMSYAKLLEAYDADVVILFSNQLTFRTEKVGELERLQRVIDACRGRGQIRLLYLDGPVMNGSAQEMGISEMAYQLCMQASGGDLQTQVLRLPWLCSGKYRDDYFHRLFETLETEGRYSFDVSRDQAACFMDIMELAELLKRFQEDWPQRQQMSVGWSFEECFANVADALQEINPSWRFDFDVQTPALPVVMDDSFVNLHYSWQPRVTIRELLPRLYQQHQEAKPALPTLRARISAWLTQHNRLIAALEFAAALALTYLCGKLTGLQVQFKLIDYRLLFVLLMSTIYGMRMGALAAVGASFLLLISYVENGTNWLTVFYEPANWLAFLAYFMTGLICGYQHLNHKEALHSFSVQNRRLRKKLQQTQELYRDVLEEKRDYRKQIVSSKDSFGKIFAITHELNVTHEKEIFIKAISVLEKVMENRSVEIYQVDDQQQKVRLVAASSSGGHAPVVSMSLDELRPVMDVIERGEIFVNNDLIDGVPMYIAGMQHQGAIRVMVAIRHVEYEQMTLYYLNLFKILCGLISSSLTRALDIQNILHEKQHIPGTSILRWDYFLKELELHRRMEERKLAVFMLLRLEPDNMTLGMVDDLLKEKTLASDIVGYSPDGRLYLILSQVTRHSAMIVKNRLAEVGIASKHVSVNEIARTEEDEYAKQYAGDAVSGASSGDLRGGAAEHAFSQAAGEYANAAGGAAGAAVGSADGGAAALRAQEGPGRRRYVRC